MPSNLIVPRGSRATSTLLAATLLVACSSSPERSPDETPADVLTTVAAEVEAAVWAFHAADTARDAEAVIELLWPEYYMFVDGARLGYDDAAQGSRDFMPTLELFHSEWTDLRITALGPNSAVASFQFRDSIVTLAGDLIQSRGPTTFVWQRREGEWRLLFGDADHYPIDP